MDVHVHVGINLQVTAVHHLYLAKALGCIVNSHGHGFAGGLEWREINQQSNREEESKQRDEEGTEKKIIEYLDS